VMVFASASARDTALSTPKSEGMLCYLKDTDCFTVYDGTEWSTWGPAANALTTWTPTVTQSGAVTGTVNRASYSRQGRKIWGTFHWTATGSGTSSNAVILGGLPATAAYSTGTTGVGYWFDTSANFTAKAILAMASTTTMSLLWTAHNAAGDDRLGIVGNTAAIASGDTISGEFTYEASADA
jgi:hypothetical protein